MHAPSLGDARFVRRIFIRLPCVGIDHDLRLAVHRTLSLSLTLTLALALAVGEGVGVNVCRQWVKVWG